MFWQRGKNTRKFVRYTVKLFWRMQIGFSLGQGPILSQVSYMSYLMIKFIIKK